MTTQHDYRERQSFITQYDINMTITVGETWYAILPHAKRRYVSLVKVASITRATILLAEEETDLSQFGLDLGSPSTRYALHDVQFLERIPQLIIDRDNRA